MFIKIINKSWTKVPCLGWNDHWCTSCDVIGVACCSRVNLENYIRFVSNFHPALQFTHNLWHWTLFPRHHVTHYWWSHQHYRLLQGHWHPHLSSSSVLTSQPLQERSSLQSKQICHLCSEDSDFLEKGSEMVSVREQHGYSCACFQNDLQAIRQLDQAGVLNNHNPSNQRSERIPS